MRKIEKVEDCSSLYSRQSSVLSQPFFVSTHCITQICVPFLSYLMFLLYSFLISLDPVSEEFGLRGLYGVHVNNYDCVCICLNIKGRKESDMAEVT